MSDNPKPEWCIIATLLPYPYKPGPSWNFRSQKIFPAGAKLHVVGGFAGPGYRVVTVVGTGHHRRVVAANIQARYLGGWRVALVYRPAILRVIRRALSENPYAAHRFVSEDNEFEFGSAEYAAYLRPIAERFQRELHGQPDLGVGE
ncbi:hypothetical protein [Nocardia arthritidis]|uniref:Uncharacterized protein n=1 Tax=Nocardia arthritidis TaxID=228602 RepID=A0A6G9Y5N9_9NOCA|nr:hypothetical protein [Nocardia arthritidis]QIS08558.1 hypothetical protein F5544_03195 [Nocardia arthritidis]